MSLVRDIFRSIERELLSGALNLAFGEGVGAKKTGNEFQPGDVDVVDILLLSEDGQRSYSLMNQAVTIEIYESIMSPVIWAEISISDSMGLLQNFPIIGEEFVKITFKTPKTFGDTATYLLRVNSVNNKQVNENNKKITYTLQCCSAELLTNAKQLVTITTNDTIKNIITNIIEDYIQSDKPVFVDSTVGLEEVKITKLTPFQAIDFIRQRAVSVRYQSSSFCFYESRKGYHFTTFERLMDDGAKIVQSGNYDKIFFFDRSGKNDSQNVTYRNIIAYNQVSFGDSIAKVQEGSLNNQVQQFDLITGDVRRLTYTDNIGADAFKSSSETSSSGQSTSFTRHHGKTASTVRLIPTSSDRSTSDLAEKITKSQAYAQKLAQNITQVHIYGDSEISLGDVINLRLPSGIDVTTGKDQISRLDSGTYTVAKIRQIILLGDRPQYTQALELIKHDIQEVSS
jgi:hypothetical protein